MNTMALTNLITVKVEDWVSPPILPTRGVKQGDPLSSVLFNIVIDHLLKSTPREFGQWLGGGVMRAVALTDDIQLIGKTPQDF